MHALAPFRPALVLVLAMVALLAVPLPAAAQYECEPNLVEVLFQPEARVRLEGDFLVDHAGAATDGLDMILDPFGPYTWEHVSPLPEEEVDLLVDQARLLGGEDIYDLNNVYRVRFDLPNNMHAVAADLEILPGVMRAYAVPLPQEAPTPDFQPQQGYLASAVSVPAGIDASVAWAQGGDGTGVTVCDLEYSWNYSHQDITRAGGSQIMYGVVDPYADNNHGTAVIGELVADNNGWGVTGICHGAGLMTAGVYYGSPPSWNVAGALMQATAMLSAGDVIVLEQQWEYTPYAGDYIPIEFWGTSPPYAQLPNAVYQAIQTAVALGINVVEAAGNGGVDIDLIGWQPVPSGAIIVGAGAAQPATDLQRLYYSSYGMNVLMQGWGENVVTCGYGDLHSSEGVNRYFTSSFNGTSSATPIVAGAVACCVSYWLQNISPIPPTPAQVMTALTTTGTPQVIPPSGAIGPRPDLAAALPTLQLPAFQDVAVVPVTGPYNCQVVAWGDYDLDQDFDLYLGHTQSLNQVLRNDLMYGYAVIPPGPHEDPGPCIDAAWADYDGDGDLDVYVVNVHVPNVLLRNDGGDVFTDVTMPPLDCLGPNECADWADIDGDGRLDLYVGVSGMPNRLFLNAGDDMFHDATMPPIDDPGYAKDVQFCDFDLDGDPDLLVANAGAADLLLRNDGGGMFIDVTPPPLQVPVHTYSAAWGDFNNDGYPDLYLVHYMTANRLLLNVGGGGGFMDVTAAPLDAPGYGESACWGDYDNDGWLDLYLARSQGANVLIQSNGGAFADASAAPVNDSGYSFACAWADHDLDGDLDLYVANDQSSNRLFQNTVGSTAGNWIKIELAGQLDNVHGVGARAVVWAGGNMYTRECGTGEGRSAQQPHVLHIGLGQAAVVDSCRVFWPLQTATTDTTSLAVNTTHLLVEPPIVPVTDDGGLPRAVALLPAMPNPFNPLTTLRFELPAEATVTMTVHDLAGRRVRTLVAAEVRNPGRHAVVWDGRDLSGRRLASGAYLVRMTVGAEALVTRVTMVK